MCVALGVIELQAQAISGLNRDQYLAKVKLVSQFFSRFNGKETKEGLALEDRVSNVKMLFDLSKFKSNDDPGYLRADTFARRVVSDSITLHYTDPQWFAKVGCSGKLKGKPVKFTLYLNVENRKENMYKWVIKNAEGSIFKTDRYQGDDQLFILPNDHEQFFMSLSKLTSETHELIDEYLRKDYKPSSLTIFETLVRQGLLKIEHTDEVEFVFMQVPGYIFTLKHFERESKNAGWLIDTLTECSEQEKIKMMEQLTAR